MLLPIACLCLLSFAISWVATSAARRIAPKFDFVDRPGQRKIHHRAMPYGGGIAIFLGFALPILAGVIYVNAFDPPGWLTSRVAANWPALWSGARDQTRLALGLLGAALLMHLLGLRDDRKALGPYVKLFAQLAIITGLVVAFPSLRALTALGKVPSIVVTVLWITAITNAFNFLDNMDGLSAGVAAVAAVAFLATAVSIQQWFVAAALAVFLGAVLGFLCFNFAPATIFMGDSGSLLLGLILGTLTIRTTYLPKDRSLGAGWYAVFAPVIVLALPLYDLLVVSAIRISRG
jgi:UDP-GlcNAc:undecaprenyl-phosphate GlcNAc-1-phosphate transferase